MQTYASNFVTSFRRGSGTAMGFSTIGYQDVEIISPYTVIRRKTRHDKPVGKALLQDNWMTRARKGADSLEAALRQSGETSHG